MNVVFMRQAIGEAKKSKEPLKCGAVIVKDNKLLAKARNSQRTLNDASAHAEIIALRKAGRKLKNKNLTGCTIYCTCEPCVMCLSALVFAKISKIVYGTPLKDVSSKKRLIDVNLDAFLAKTPYKVKVVKKFLEDECARLVKGQK